eukprot:4596180-Pyramimonas_sp.AAC.1
MCAALAHDPAFQHVLASMTHASAQLVDMLNYSLALLAERLADGLAQVRRRQHPSLLAPRIRNRVQASYS